MRPPATFGQSGDGWSVGPITFPQVGEIDIDLSANLPIPITTSASGSLVLINFTVKSGGVPLGATPIDLAGNTDFSDGLNYSDYVNAGALTNPFVTNVQTTVPFDYSPSAADPNSAPADPNDGLVTITGTNSPPVAVTDSYTVTQRTLSTDPNIKRAGRHGSALQRHRCPVIPLDGR